MPSSIFQKKNSGGACGGPVINTKCDGLTQSTQHRKLRVCVNGRHNTKMEENESHPTKSPSAVKSPRGFAGNHNGRSSELSCVACLALFRPTRCCGLNVRRTRSCILIPIYYSSKWRFSSVGGFKMHQSSRKQCTEKRIHGTICPCLVFSLLGHSSEQKRNAIKDISGKLFGGACGPPS